MRVQRIDLPAIDAALGARQAAVTWTMVLFSIVWKLPSLANATWSLANM